MSAAKSLSSVLPVLILSALVLLASPQTARAEELIVSAAASLTNALAQVARDFEAAHPGVRVTANYGASGALLRQMENGAPVDVFASADQQTMDQAVAKGLVSTATRRNFARNALVLVVPAEAKAVPSAEKDLANPRFGRIALGNPGTVPAGRYAREHLLAAGLWGALTPKYIYGNNVRQVLDYVARGEVDAAYVYATDARQAGPRVRVVLEAATKAPALYPVAVAVASKKPAARAFADYLVGPEAQRVLGAFGFGKP